MPASDSRAWPRQQARLLDFVVESSEDAIFLGAPGGELFFANPAASRLFGYTSAEFLDGGLALIWDEGPLETIVEGADVNGAVVVLDEQKVRRKDGHVMWVRISVAHFDVGGLDRLALVVHSRQREEALLPSQSLSPELLDANTPLMLYVTDANWRILWANNDKAIGSGYSLTELQGQPSPLRRYLGEKEPLVLEAIEGELERTGKWAGDLFSRRRNGEVYPIRANISVIEGFQPGDDNRLVMLADVSTIRETERLLRRVALHDPTTNLPNRTLFEQGVGKALGHASVGSSRLYLLLMDIDKFGMVNEALGYEAADMLLRRFSERLRVAVGDETLLSRHTSDTFALLVPQANSPIDIAALCTRIRDSLREPLEVNDHQFNLSLSIGVSGYPEDGETCDELLRAAKVALRRAKSRGGNSHAHYRRGAEALSRRFVALASPIREGLERNQFRAAFQPIVQSEDGQVVAMEALARWKCSDGTLVSPADFIPVAEGSGAIRDIFQVVLRDTCHHLRRLDETGHPGLSASINLSARQLVDWELPEAVAGTILSEGLDPARIQLEITESVLVAELQQTAQLLTALQREGIKIVIDDFGVGYSSFGYLKHFQVDGIKIDRSFVNGIPGSRKDETLVSMILAMGRELDIPVVAEGVETEAQAEFLRTHQCARLQGFLFAPALSHAEFVKFLETGPATRSAPVEIV